MIILQFLLEVVINEERQAVSRPFKPPKTERQVDIYFCKRGSGCDCGCGKGNIKIIVTENNPTGTIRPEGR